MLRLPLHARVRVVLPGPLAYTGETSNKNQMRATVLLPLLAGETLLRKLGRADMVKKQSVPEIVFAYFHNK